MKIKFLLAAFAAVTMFASCTEEALNTSGSQKGNELEGRTAVTFSLNLKQPGTKAFDFLPDTTFSSLSTTELLINPSDVKVLIYDEASGLLEVKADMDAQAPYDEASFTAIINAGLKKIFVFANCTAVTGFSTWYAGLTEDLSPLADVYTQTFDALVPQFVPWVNKAGTRTFDITPLYTRASGYGLPASTTNQYSYKVVSGVDINQSKDNTNGGGPQQNIDGTVVDQLNNHFDLDMFFLVSKARLSIDNGVTDFAKAVVTNLSYSIHNLGKYTSLVLNVVGGRARSAIFGKSFDNGTTGITVDMLTTPPSIALDASTTPANHYLRNFDGANSTAEPVATFTSGLSSHFIYVPEATHGTITRGMAPYYAINGTYKPKMVVDAITWNSTQQQKVIMNTSTIDAIVTAGGSLDYFVINRSFTGNGGELEIGTCFATDSLLREAVWLTVYGAGAAGGWDPIGDPGQVPAANLLIGACPPEYPTVAVYLQNPQPVWGYYAFTGCQSWWRANVGGTLDDGNNYNPGAYINPADLPYANPDPNGWGTLRGVAYDATISEIKGPGVPYEWMLDTDKPDPLTALTEITIIVKIMDWAHATAPAVILEQ